MALSFLLLSVLLFSPSCPEDLNKDHFRRRPRGRMPQFSNPQIPHSSWMHFSMGCTHGTPQKAPKTFSMHKIRKEYSGLLQIIYNVTGNRAEANADFNPHPGNGFQSVMFSTKEKRVDCMHQRLLKSCYKPDCLGNRTPKVMLKRNIALPVKKLIGMMKNKEVNKESQFKKIWFRHKQVFPPIQSKDSFPALLPDSPKKLQKTILSGALNKNRIKQFVQLTRPETKMRLTAKMLNKCKTTQSRANRQTGPLKRQTTKTMFLIEKLVSRRNGIKVKSLKSMAGTIQKGAFNSMKDVSKASKIRHLSRYIVLDYNMKNKTDIIPALVTTSTQLQKIKSAAANPKMHRAVIIEDFNNKWDLQPKTRTKTEHKTDTELRFVTEKQTIKPQSTFQMLGLRMREESPDERTVEDTEKEFIPSWRTVTEEVELKTTQTGENPLCKGLIHQTEAGLMYCKDRLEKSNRKSKHGLLSGRKSEIFHNAENDGEEYNHFYYFDGVLKRVRNNPLNQQY